MKIQQFYLPLIILLAALFLWQWQCNKPKEKTTVKEVVRVVEVPVKGDTVFFQPAPEVVRIPGPERIREVLKTVYVTDPATGKVDTQLIPRDTAVPRDYYVTREYWDTTRTKYGPIITNNVVSENKLQMTQTVYDLTGVERTIDRTTVQRAGALYGGFRLMGNRVDILHGYNANLAYKTKGDRVYEVGAWRIQGLPVQWEAGVKFKLLGK